MVAGKMEEDIRLFLNYLAKEKKCSKNTLDAYNNDLSQLADFIATTGSGGYDVNQLTDKHLSMYMAFLKNKSYTLSTIARKIAAARTFLKFMADRGKVNSDMAPRLSAPKVVKAAPKALTVQEVQRLMAEAARLPSIDAKRDRAMLELLYASGMLASELMSLNVENIDLERSRINIASSRGRSRVIPLDSRMRSIIKEYIDAVRIKILTDDKERALFLNQRGERLTRQGFWQIIQSYADSAGITSKVTPRSIRHSFAVHRLSSGADIHAVQEVLGHAHISTTKAYKQV